MKKKYTSVGILEKHLESINAVNLELLYEVVQKEREINNYNNAKVNELYVDIIKRQNCIIDEITMILYNRRYQRFKIKYPDISL